ncbi:hypothetical protein ASPTUDRAFT_902815 [Aspergillus tubingensis CBS 134.48]|uniref:Uncharacterized protein n=1 Tax=Aspergillus tubingensis (strain CBS 134.48) TaxID=767770 RepID=A0A1L9MS91_ASPTC|nr:hypothetical protein ASPTUDRAFT_902815 [Aspergillus tubingensis CBS 134.48]
MRTAHFLCVCMCDEGENGGYVARCPTPVPTIEGGLFFWFCITLFSEHGGSCIWLIDGLDDWIGYICVYIVLLQLICTSIWRNVKAKVSARLSILVQEIVAFQSIRCYLRRYCRAPYRIKNLYVRKCAVRGSPASSRAK